jgi:hypothetical protein
VRLAWQQAPLLCRETAAGCETYHRVRPALRRLGLAAEPADQHAFLFPALVDALTRVGPRVLVSGSVDEAMAAMVVAAGAEAGRTADITVLDRCGTPLVVNDAFAAATGAAVSTVRSDIVAFRAAEPFDAVVTHSFLGSIAPARRPHLAANWFALLRPGGCAITVARQRPAGEARAFSPQSGERLAAEVSRRAAACAPDIGIAPDDLAVAARRYAEERRPSYPVRDLDEIVGLLAGVGFRIAHAATRATPGRVVGIEGPGLPRSGTYAEVVAVRD